MKRKEKAIRVSEVPIPFKNKASKAIKPESIENISTENSKYLLRKRKLIADINKRSSLLINCHICHKVSRTSCLVTCSNSNCKESYCYSCIKNFYVNYYFKF